MNLVRLLTENTGSLAIKDTISELLTLIKRDVNIEERYRDQNMTGSKLISFIPRKKKK